MHRIAPPLRLPQFYIEAGYLTDFSMAWKLMRSGQAVDGQHAIDFEFLAQWYRYRERLAHYVSMIGFNPHNQSRDVKPCLEFVDALVRDWTLLLSGKEPVTPLDIARLQALGEHRNRLNDIPGEDMVKY